MKKLFLLLIILSGSVVAMQRDRYDTDDGYCECSYNEKNEITTIRIYSQDDTGSLSSCACRQADGTWRQTTILNGKIEKKEILSKQPPLPPRKWLFYEEKEKNKN